MVKSEKPFADEEVAFELPAKTASNIVNEFICQCVMLYIETWYFMFWFYNAAPYPLIVKFKSTVKKHTKITSADCHR